MSDKWTTSPGFDRSERWHAAKARRAYDTLNAKPRTVTGTTLAAQQAVDTYESAASGTDPVSQASAPVLLILAKDALIEAGVALRFELDKLAAHLQTVQHTAQALERRGDEGDAVIGRLLWALASGDDAAVEAATAAACHHMLGPSRHIAESIRASEARVAARRAATAPAVVLEAVPA